MIFFLNFKFKNNLLKLGMVCFSLMCLQGWCIASHLSDVSSAIDDSSPSYQEFFSHISYTFNDLNLLELTITHSSEDLGITSALRGNERLEFLGDALLEFGLRIALWNNAPESFKMELPTVFSSLAENAALSHICEHIGLDKLGSFPPPSSLTIKNAKRDPLLDAKADRLEALVGAIFLDSKNMDSVFSFIERYWFSEVAPYNFRRLFPTPSEQLLHEQEKIGYIFKDRLLLHYASGKKAAFGFLGKGLLKFVFADCLYRRFPDLPEGELTKRIDALSAKEFLPDFPVLREKSVFDANALISSIYFDSNLETVTNFIMWHWVNPNRSSEIKTALQKNVLFSISKTVTIIPPTITTDTASKTLLLSLLGNPNQDPFTTEAINTGFQASVCFGAIHTIFVTASSKREAERLAAEKGLEELAYIGLLESGTVSPVSYPFEFFTKILEIYTRKHFGNDFNCHVIAKHPLGKHYRLEVQGAGMPSVITEAESLEESKYRALSASLCVQFNDMWHIIKIANYPIITLSEPLKMYKRLCTHKLSEKDHGFEISAHSKEKIKTSPLLVYDITLPKFSVTLNGMGHSKEIAELDCVREALSYIEQQNA